MALAKKNTGAAANTKKVGMNTPSTTNTEKSVDATEKKDKSTVEYRYAKSNGHKIWTDTAVGTFKLRYNKTNDRSDMIFQINALDENKKFIKDAEGKTESISFSFSENDICVVAKLLPQFMTQKILGIIINHVNAETNSGIQFQLVYVDSVPTLVISLVENSNITKEMSIPMTKTYTFQYWNANGEITESTMNIELVKVENLFKSAMSTVTFAKNICDVCGGGSGFGNRFGGSVKQSNAPSIKADDAEGLASALNGIDDDDDLPFDVEENNN